VYDGALGHIASFKFAVDAAKFTADVGGEVRYHNGTVVWREGREEFSVREDSERAIKIMLRRCELVKP
jgi:hypothetical protein